MARTFHVRDVAATIIDTSTSLYNEKEYNVILALGASITLTTDEDYLVTQAGSHVTTQAGGHLIMQ